MLAPDQLKSLVARGKIREALDTAREFLAKRAENAAMPVFVKSPI